MNSPSLRQRAFTLVELLIVITIIGILAVALLPRIAGGPAKARDAARKADLQAIATALEFYADDNGGVYPITAAYVCNTLAAFNNTVSPYLTSTPAETAVRAAPHLTCYQYISTTGKGATAGAGYILRAELENTNARGSNIYALGDIPAGTPGSTTALNLPAAANLYGDGTPPASNNFPIFVITR